MFEKERRTGGGDELGQRLLAAGFVEGVIVGQVGRVRKEVGDDAGVPGGFLADVERGHVEAATAHKTNEVLDVAARLFGVVLFECVADEDEVVQEGFGVGVGVFGGGLVFSHALDVAVGMLDFGTHQGEQAAVGFVVVVFGVVVKDGDAKAGVVFVACVYGGVDGDDAGAMQQAFAQMFELFAVVAQHVVGVHQYRLFGGLVGDKRVAVTVAANPRAKAQQRR